MRCVMGIHKIIGLLLIVCVALVLLGFVFSILKVIFRVVIPIVLLAAALVLGVRLLGGWKS